MTISRNLIGFEEIFKLLDIPTKPSKQDFPPHNLIKLSDTESLLTLPVVGRTKDDILIELQNNILYINVKSFKFPDSSTVLEHGIAFRSFKKEFKLHEYIEIKSADVLNGLLNIRLEYVIPEEKLAKTILIS